VISGLPDRRQIIYQCPGPIKYDIAQLRHAIRGTNPREQICPKRIRHASTNTGDAVSVQQEAAGVTGGFEGD